MRSLVVLGSSLLALLAMGCPSPSQPDEAAQLEPRYHHHDDENRGVIVFVHGVMGDGAKTWARGDKYWPQLLLEDEESTFEGFNVYVHEFDSPLFKGSVNPDQVAEKMQLHFQADGVFDHDEVVFLVHSMGGIVTRAFLQKYQRQASKVRFIYFFATPTEGAEIAAVADFLSKNPQFGQMAPFDKDSYLANQMRSWIAADFPFPSYCAHEEKKVLGTVLVVNMRSASALCDKPPLISINEDHIGIVKPDRTSHASYLAFRNAFEETRPAITMNIPAGWTLDNVLATVAATEPCEGVGRRVEYATCEAGVPEALLIAGPARATDFEELTRKLARRFETQVPGLDMVVSDNRERCSYEVTCQTVDASE